MEFNYYLRKGRAVFLVIAVFLLAGESVLGRLGDSAETIVIGVGHGYVWSPTGDRLAFVSSDTVCIYSLANGVRTVIGHGAVPHWSPTGEYLAYATGDSLCVYDCQKNLMVAVKFGSGFGFSWSGDQSLVTIVSRPDTIPEVSNYACNLKSWSYNSVKTNLVLDSSATREILSLTRPILESTRGYVLIRARSSESKRLTISPKGISRRGTSSRFIGVESHFPVIHAGGGTVYDDENIWLIDTAGVAAKSIDPPNDSFFPLLSPNGLYVLVTDVRGHTAVFDTSGNQVADVPEAGGGVWGHDSRYFIFERTRETEADIVGGDLFRYSLTSNLIVPITNSPDNPELEVRVSPDGQWIAFNTKSGLSLRRLEGGSDE